MADRAGDELLDRLHPDEGILDLRTVDWVRPAVMVGVAALAHRASGVGAPLEVRAPTDREPASYAARMRLGRVLSEFGVAHDLPSSRERDQREHLIEVTLIDGDAAADRLAALVYRKLRPLDVELARAMHGSVGEIGANAPEHSGTVGFMAAQTLPRRNELLLAVGDAGVGIRATLANRGATDDESAIELATREHVSEFDEPDRGAGLPASIRLVTGQRGSLYIATGTSSIRHFGRTRRYLSSPHAYAGTLVEIRIPLS